MKVNPEGDQGALELVRRFVNTLEVDEGVDSLDRDWLVAQGLLERGRGVSSEDLSRLADVREALRELLLANNGLSADVAGAASDLDAAARRSGLAVRFSPEGTASIEPAKGGADRAVGLILASAATAMRTESWGRLKACRAPDCRWAFLDASRNCSRSWCSMSVCGNRAKARAYRARHQG
jgi:predicted RNA-binding Zn ribbon-like protein